MPATGTFGKPLQNGVKGERRGGRLARRGDCLPGHRSRGRLEAFNLLIHSMGQPEPIRGRKSVEVRRRERPASYNLGKYGFRWTVTARGLAAGDVREELFRFHNVTASLARPRKAEYNRLRRGEPHSSYKQLPAAVPPADGKSELTGRGSRRLERKHRREADEAGGFRCWRGEGAHGKR